VSICRREKSHIYLSSFTENYLKKAGDNLQDLFGNDCLDKISKAQVIHAKGDQWDNIKLKSVCTKKEIINSLFHLSRAEKLALEKWNNIFSFWGGT
jgi:hypothetical protein